MQRVSEEEGVRVRVGRIAQYLVMMMKEETMKTEDQQKEEEEKS